MPRTKTMMITGGTSGIGLAGAREMAARGFRLILIGRHAERGRKAIASLSIKAQDPHRLITADLSLISEIRSVIANLEATEPAIDVLANNAGTWFNRRELTPEGIERTIAINHLAYVALTLGLKPLLLKAHGARVINTGSFVYRHARYDPNNLQSQKRFSTNVCCEQALQSHVHSRSCPKMGRHRHHCQLLQPGLRRYELRSRGRWHA